MAVIALTDLPRGGALVALDLGEKTIGVAVSDGAWISATPLITLTKAKFGDNAAQIFRIMDERGAIGLIIGLPINMDGSEGPRAQSSRAFGRNLLRLKDLPIAFWDERLSTSAVERMMIDEADLSRARRDAVVDKLAAAWILQGALERLRP